MKSKKELRKEILKNRDALTVEERSEKSKIIAQKVISHKVFQEADIVLLYASYKSEVDTIDIFEAAILAEKEVFYPKVIGDEMEFYRVQEQTDLIEGYRGIREPKENEKAKFIPDKDSKICVIMPGAVFDKEGNRIGYGGGYYDKYLGQLERNVPKENITKIGLAYDCQIVPVRFIEREKHDIRTDIIFSIL